jgi:hypothetical protein
MARSGPLKAGGPGRLDGYREERSIAENVRPAFSISLVTKKQVHLEAETGAHSRKDWIGHAFVVLKSPVVTRAVGFYPVQVPGFVLDKGAFWCIGQRGMAGELLDDEHFLSDAHYDCRVTTYLIGKRQHARVTRFVAEFESAVHAGRIRYHAFSQCANFALQALRAAGVGPWVRFPYPPFLHWWCHD